MNSSSKFKDNKDRKEYLWGLYRGFIKKRDKNDSDDEVTDEQKIAAANEIISLCKPMESYTPYVLSCLSMAEHYLNIKDHKKVKEWLIKVDRSLLENKSFRYTSQNEEMYWSQLHKYLELKAYCFLLNDNSDEFIWTRLCLIEQCETSELQKNFINSSIHNELIKNNSDEELVENLLLRRGFTNKNVREEYRNILYNRFKNYLYYDKGNGQAVFEPNFARITACLTKEILVPKFRTLQPSNKTSKAISATDLSDFSFCPASHAIQVTYNLKKTAIANIGTIMHREQLLMIDRRKVIKDSFYSFARTKNYNDLKDEVLTQEIKKSIMPLLNDIASSELIFCDQNDDENKQIFYNKDKTICGIPDYVFKRKDGTFFIVEEKFSLLKESSKKISKPYVNHRFQLGTYSMFLENIKASYGYIIYWLYNFDKHRHPDICEAKSFRIDSSKSLKAEIEIAMDHINELQNKKTIDFKIEELNPRKCVNCISTELCLHKTGTVKNLHIPYNVGRQ